MSKDVRLIERIGGTAGILFAILFVAGAFAPAQPSSDTAASWIKLYSKSGDRLSLVIGGYLWVLAGLALLVLTAAAWRRFGTREGVAGLCSSVAGICAVVFSVILMAGGVLTAAIAGNKVFGGMAVPGSGDLLMQLTNTGTAFVLLPGGLTAALGLAAISATIRAERGPNWLVVLGGIAAICCVFGVVFVPMVALPIWILIASIRLLRGAGAEQPMTAAPATAG